VKSAALAVVSEIGHEKPALYRSLIRHRATEKTKHALVHRRGECDCPIESGRPSFRLDLINSVAEHLPDVAKAMKNARVITRR
jgi:hypothetical protein